VLPAGVSKAWGLERLRLHLGVNPKDTLAFGDELNDLAMLRWAGHAVAMPAAPAEVKAAADTIAPAGPEEDGVAQVINGLWLPPVTT